MVPHFGSNTSNSINITKNDIGIIISSQNFAYAISKLFFGMLSDIASNRILFGSGLFISGLLNIGIKKDIDMLSLYFQSFLLGLAQGPAWPSAAKILQNWLPKSQFASWWSILSTASNLAGTFGPIIGTWIAVKYHWSYVFMIPGCVCMSMGYLAIIVLRNKPSDVGQPDFNFETDSDTKKEEPSDKEQEEQVEEQTELTRWQKLKLLMKYPFFISICLGFFLVQLVKTLYTDWSNIYLTKAVLISHFKATYFVSLFEFSGLVGSIVTGVLSDFLFHFICVKKKKFSSLDQIQFRMLIVLVYLILNFFAMHFFNFHVKKNFNHDLVLYAISATSGFLLYGTISLFGVMAMEFTTYEFSGTSHAVATLAANLGAIFAGLPFSMLSRVYNWNTAFKIVQFFSVFIIFIMVLFCRSQSHFALKKELKKKTQ